MIKINKSTAIPTILTKKGIVQTNALKTAYQLNPTLYTSAVGISNRILTSIEFDSSIYGDTSVKTLLINDQYEKCCFCESKFLDNSYGDVEHFRPKKAYKKKGAKGLTYPGYYWLAYDWTNLMFSCEKCNRSYKRNEFPLNDEATRKPFFEHTNQLENEDCLLINPNIENPSDFITFKEEVPVAVNGNHKGATTIKIFQLERMNNSRLEHLLLLEGILAFTRIDTSNDQQIKLAMDTFNFSRETVLKYVTNANIFFNSAAKDTAKFAHCVRSKFPSLPVI